MCSSRRHARWRQPSGHPFVVVTSPPDRSRGRACRGTRRSAFLTTVRIHSGLRSWVPAAIGPGSSPGMRMTRNSASPAKAGVSVRQETPACAGDAVFIFRRHLRRQVSSDWRYGYLPAQVSSGSPLGVMPDGCSHLGIHASLLRDPQMAFGHRG